MEWRLDFGRLRHFSIFWYILFSLVVMVIFYHRNCLFSSRLCGVIQWNREGKPLRGITV